MLSFVGAGIACAFVGLCYAELSTVMPASGSTYTYAYATLGELAAWIIGWDLILEYSAGAATVAVGWSGYAASLLHGLGIDLPHGLINAPCNVPAAAIVLVLTALLIGGTRESAGLNNIMVALKLIVVLAFVAVGAWFVEPHRWRPLIPANDGQFGHFGWSGLLRGAGVVFYAYVGFDSVSTAAGEARDPSRDMPIGLIGSLVACTLLYVVVSGVLTGIVPFGSLGVPDPIALATDRFGLPWFAILIKVGALIGLTTVILVSLYAQSRILLTMADDGLIPDLFARIHPRLRTPAWSQALIGLVVAVTATLLPIEILGQIVSIGTLFAFVIVCVATVQLRRTDPARNRPFRVPAVPLVPVLGALSCLALMASLPASSWLRLVVWLAIGLAIYGSFGRRHSRLRASG
jgi:APA family basic amino acid/polyamine antiporter